MKITLVFLLLASFLVAGCGEKTADELRAEQAAKDRAVKNRNAYEK